MLDIGWSEMTVVLIILLVVVGPSELPRLIKGIRSFTSGVQRVRSEIRGHVDEMIRESDVKEMLESEKQSLSDTLGDTLGTEKGTLADSLSPLKEVVSEVREMQSELANVGREASNIGKVGEVGKIGEDLGWQNSLENSKEKGNGQT